jgi:large repetitive protein
VNVDSNSSTFDASTAALNMPTGASVLFAGLYWMGSSSSAQRNQVLLATPATGSTYSTITGTVIGDSSGVTPTPPQSSPNYEGFANVTAQVKAAGNGNYTVANVQALTGQNSGGYYAGWSLVVAYQAPGLPARNLAVFDGYAVVQKQDPSVNIAVSGFTAPPAGTVNAKVGVVAAEGDLGITGDSMQLNGTTLSDAQSPSTNFFDSVISNLGTLQTAKNPNYKNQLRFDAKIVQVPAGTIPNSATSATVHLTSSQDTYYPGVVTTAIDLYAPDIEPTKTVTDLSGGNSLPGDVLKYTITVPNTGQDPATNVVLTDPIPANTAYVPGSLSIVSGPNAGNKTDATGDDQAFFDAANNQVVFNLGTGATATAGGTLAINASTSITFNATVNSSVPANTVITNQASISYKGSTTGFSFSALSPATAFTVVNSLADLAVSKTVSNATPNVGDNITYTVKVTNQGPGPATGATVTDLLPAGLQLVNATTSQGAYDGGTGLWTVGSLANAASATLTIVATVVSSAAQTNIATISHTDSVDPISTNNQASATETPQQADLSVSKTVDNASPNVGGTVNFVITVADAGPNAATNVQLTDLLPAGLTYVSSAPSLGTYNSTTGLWTVGTIAKGGSATLQLKATVTGAAAVVNTAAVTHSDQFDPNTANNSAGAAVTPQQADLAIGKSVSNASPNVGDTITYTVTLTDLGPNSATNVTVQDRLPAGLTFVSATPSQGTYNSTSGLWTVGTVDTSSARTLTLTAKVVSTAAQINTASIGHADQVDSAPAETGGFLVLPSNIGTHQTSRFSVVPEVGVNLGYAITPGVRVSIGYTFMFWTQVVRPGDQIDLRVNTTQPGWCCRMLPCLRRAGTSGRADNHRSTPARRRARG